MFVLSTANVVDEPFVLAALPGRQACGIGQGLVRIACGIVLQQAAYGALVVGLLLQDFAIPAVRLFRLLLGLDMQAPENTANQFKPGPGDTPELHLGSAGQQGFGNAESGGEGTRRFSVPAALAMHKFALGGSWEITRQYARTVGTEVELQLRFKAARLYMVASADSTTALEVTVDGNPQPAVEVQGSRLYTLFDSHDDREHVLHLRIPRAGLRVYSFTFG